MKTAVRIVDYGRGPQIEGNRLTVMDVFYYLHRDCDWDFIHYALPGLTRAEFDAVVEYVNEHRDELIEKDNRVEERNRREMAEQEARGIRRPIDTSIPLEERIEKMRAVLRQRMAERAERNGDHSPR